MDTEAAPGRTWRVGELAGATGVSVRTLHHYDRLGLVPASRRSSAGHRRYTEADVRRLHRVLALRGFGLSLAEIGQVLDDDVPEPRALIERQLLQAEEQLANATRLRRRLVGVLDGLDNASEPSAHVLLELMEAMTEMDRKLTEEELDAMSQRRREWADSLPPEQLAEMNQRRRQAAAELGDGERARMQERRAALLPDGR